MLAPLALSISAHAATVIGVKFPDQVEVSGKILNLNGLGVRKKSIVMGITVNVYVAGLYIEKTSQAADEIITSSDPKKLSMIFTHGVDKDALKSAWKENFSKNCETKCEALQSQLTKLLDVMGNVEDKDSMDYIFSKDSVEIVLKGKSKVTITSADFSKVLLRTWLVNPPNDELRDGLLGKLKP